MRCYATAKDYTAMSDISEDDLSGAQLGLSQGRGGFSIAGKLIRPECKIIAL